MGKNTGLSPRVFPRADEALTEQTVAIDSRAEFDGFRALFHASPLGMGLGSFGRGLEVNAAGARMFGYQDHSEFMGVDLEKKISPRFREEWKRWGQSRERGFPEPASHVTWGVRRDGSEFPLQADVERVALHHGCLTVVFLRDLTRQFETEEALRTMQWDLLRQTQQMEAMGRLAAGMAHEINTPLQYIGDNAAFLKKAFQDILGWIQRDQGTESRIQGDAGAPIPAQAPLPELGFLIAEIPAALRELQEGVEKTANVVRALMDISFPGRVTFR